MHGCRKEIDGVAGITRRLLFDYYREKPRKSCPARLSRFFLKMVEICAIPTKPLPCRAFQFAGLIIPTLKAAGSNPVGRTKEDPVTTRFMFIGTQCDLWGKPDGTRQQRRKVRTYSFYLASLYCYHYRLSASYPKKHTIILL